MVEINNTTKQKIDLKKTQKIAESFLRFYKKSGQDVSLAVIGEIRMKRLNKEYRRIDKTTDVLSFGGGKEPGYLGEVIINIRETKNPDKYLEIFGRKEKPATIFYFLLVHGLLHLVGYDDKTDKTRQEMIDLGKKFLEKFI
ncbi:MAG: rRNA maturation RNase YbeY [Patescibacteria group bacterium]